jgi:hypothetical protein
VLGMESFANMASTSVRSATTVLLKKILKDTYNKKGSGLHDPYDLSGGDRIPMEPAMSSDEAIRKAEQELIRKGFQFVLRARCCFCKKDFEWWRTPTKRLIPLTAANLEPHWWQCRRAFRNNLPPAGPRPYIRYEPRW